MLPQASFYQLICAVAGAENLNPTIIFQWIKNSPGTQTQVGTNSNTLSFTPLQLFDAANYVCTATIASNYLISDIEAMNSHSIRFQSKL